MIDATELQVENLTSPPLIGVQPRVAPLPAVRSIAHVAEAVVMLAVVACSAALELVGLQDEGFGNTYYAAAVRSMLASWRNFFYVSSDLGGFVSVDKPPLGLWVQVLSAKVLGFNGVALLLPQALAGVASVALLYLIVRRAFGPLAGVMAAAALAVVPISVVTARNNTMDATLVLTLVIAAWLTSLAAESGRLRLLLLAAALVGLGFNIKMLQAYLVVPGFALAYLACAPVTWRRKLVHLGAASAVLLVVSLAWCVAVDLTPASLRPYVGSSGTNSAIALALTYNGLGRVTQVLAPWFAALHINLPLDLANMPGMAPGIGNPSLGRLFSINLAGEASWLLLPALLGGVCALWAVFAASRGAVAREPLRQKRIALAVWGGWLLTCAAYFSFARFYHTYYLTMLGPAVAALAGIGIAALWRSYTRGELLGWVLPIVLAASGVMDVHFASASTLWQARLEPWILGLTLGASLVLVGARLARTGAAWQRTALSLGLVGVLLAPGVWSVTSVQSGAGGAWLPSAGPSGAFGGGPVGGFAGAPGGAFGGGTTGGFAGNPGGAFGGGTGRVAGTPGGAFGGGTGSFAGNPGGGGQRGFGGGRPNAGGFGGGSIAMTFAGQNWDSLDPNLVSFLEANQASTPYLAATTTSSYASVLTLLTDQPVMALGGYQGWDRILDPTQLATLVQQGTLRFFLLPGNSGGRGPGANSQDATSDLTAWVQSACSVVPASTWQGQSNGLQLYDCAAMSSTG